jgi:hypothetical protein
MATHPREITQKMMPVLVADDDSATRLLNP